ncbi:uncharacterized protein LOC126848179 [Cataglyphis hispanica]|uniref:uncharacterized protein LOC126848179 n=1 Tax=Cataglyphis hispanica TaxID=1086592 RepID=UPI00218011C4|nr:uncharacterized protein LOC126848179 [Cataglyphis hispanica]
MYHNQEMEYNCKVNCNEALEEIDQNIVKIELKCEQNFDTVAVNLSPSIEEYMVLPKRRGRRRKTSLELIKLQSSKLNYSTADLKSGLWKDRFRPIRPKLSPSKSLSFGASPLKHKSFGMSSPSNMPILTLNVSEPSKDKTLDSPSKTNHCIKINNVDTRGIISTIKECKINKNASLNTMASSKDLHNIKITSISHKNSIELFFASMAQTVLNLPREVQADIKMQICKIVTMAEIKYSGLQIKS